MEPLSAGILAGGALLGGLASRSSGEQAGVPDWMKEALSPYRRELKKSMPYWDPQYFPDPTYAPMSPFTEGAIGQLGGFDVSPSTDYYSGLLTGTEGGLPEDFQRAVMEPAIENVASRFASAGRYGSPASKQMMTESGMRALAPYWNQQEQRRYQAAGALPQMQDYGTRRRLEAGGLEEAWGQKDITDRMARWEFEQNALPNRLATWGSLYNPIIGAPTVGIQPSGSTLSGALGGALTAASAYNTLSDTFGWGQPPSYENPGAAFGSFNAPVNQSPGMLPAPSSWNQPGSWGNPTSWTT